MCGCRRLILASVPLLVFMVLVLSAPKLWAGELQVHDPATCTGIEDRVPIGVSDTFPASVQRVYAFTRIVGAVSDTFVTHKWYYGDRPMAEVRLPVRSSDWRTFSSKNILPGWTGQWRVDIVDENGTVIGGMPFTVE
jgi:hypothetical protein